MSRKKFNFPAARNIRVVNFGENSIEISWDDENPKQEESK